MNNSFSCFRSDFCERSDPAGIFGIFIGVKAFFVVFSFFINRSSKFKLPNHFQTFSFRRNFFPLGTSALSLPFSSHLLCCLWFSEYVSTALSVRLPYTLMIDDTLIVHDYVVFFSVLYYLKNVQIRKMIFSLFFFLVALHNIRL